MEVTGSITEQEFTVEIDSSDLWSEIEGSVEECADERISNYMEYYEHDVDFSDGALNLLREYNPGNGCGLAREFVDSPLASTRYRLIGGNIHTAKSDCIVQRFQRHHHLNGRTIWIGNDSRMIGLRVRVDFRHDQRNVVIVSKM